MGQARLGCALGALLSALRCACYGACLQGSLLVQADCPLGHMEPMQQAGAHFAPLGGIAGAHSSGSRAGSSIAGGHSPSSTRKVHNGVEHSPTEGGAFGGTMLPASIAASLADSGGSSGATAASQQQQQHAAPQHAEQRLVYSERCGRVCLRNVRVRNAGIDFAHPGNVYWRHKVGWARGGRGRGAGGRRCFAWD